ncbi:hypothetical protein NPIL_667481 [Nephila pilipes]|uniref:Uncharacterized protein n=1 Tax=Nephila pilipes TaxID=299642 RepID=A0A8X6UC16_NEPPI|nr:hypothetical protein NPIL_667481 [Nephila pilipes]
MNPLNRPKKDEKKKSTNEHRLKLQTILKEKREVRTTRPVSHTAPTTYAEAAKSSPVETIQDSNQSPSPASSSNITNIFQQLKDPELPTRPQVRRNESPATIDFGLTKGLSNTTVTVIEDFSSDHLPLMFNCNINDYFPPRNNYYKFTNWKKFQELLQNSIAGNPSITTTEEIDAAAAAFSQKIQSTINQSSTSKIFPTLPYLSQHQSKRSSPRRTDSVRDGNRRVIRTLKKKLTSYKKLLKKSWKTLNKA